MLQSASRMEICFGSGIKVLYKLRKKCFNAKNMGKAVLPPLLAQSVLRVEIAKKLVPSKEKKKKSIKAKDPKQFVPLDLESEIQFSALGSRQENDYLLLLLTDQVPLVFSNAPARWSWRPWPSYRRSVCVPGQTTDRVSTFRHY